MKAAIAYGNRNPVHFSQNSSTTKRRPFVNLILSAVSAARARSSLLIDGESDFSLDNMFQWQTFESI